MNACEQSTGQVPPITGPPPLTQLQLLNICRKNALELFEFTLIVLSAIHTYFNSFALFIFLPHII
jgi:hypothetical protein